VAAALEESRRDGEPFAGSSDPRSAGNGRLLRLAPIAVSFHPEVAAVGAMAARRSRTTVRNADAVALSLRGRRKGTGAP
jgi:ADP-ribosyl-[dinitrogen reductase] hydrolase